MKAKLQTLRIKLSTIFSKHLAFVVMCIFLLIASFVVYRLTVLSSMEPNPDVIADEKLKIKAVQFDQDSIKQIESLRESNVKTPGTDIQKNRQNPFKE